jgi:hypothetical protein
MGWAGAGGGLDLRLFQIRRSSLVLTYKNMITGPFNLEKKRGTYLEHILSFCQTTQWASDQTLYLDESGTGGYSRGVLLCKFSTADV